MHVCLKYRCSSQQPIIFQFVHSEVTVIDFLTTYYMKLSVMSEYPSYVTRYELMKGGPTSRSTLLPESLLVMKIHFSKISSQSCQWWYGNEMSHYHGITSSINFVYTYICIYDKHILTTTQCHKVLSMLIHLPLVPQICVSEWGQHWFGKWLVTYSVPNHYLNQCWIIINSTLRNKLQWNFNQNTQLLIHKN